MTRNITAAAELSWLLLMSVARPFRAAIQEPLAGEWDRNKYPGTMLRGRTLGVIGCGRIGTWVSRYAAAFEMKVLGYDPLVSTLPDTFEPVDLDTLLATSDMVTLHVELQRGRATSARTGSASLRMKRGAVLVNTSRGELVDEAALLDALKSGHLSGAGLDVLQGEPDIDDHPLVGYAREHPNLVITPHIGGLQPRRPSRGRRFLLRENPPLFQRPMNGDITRLADCLTNAGVRYAFGVSGSGPTYQLIAALKQRGVRYVPVSHEAVGPVAAGAYGFLTGSPAVALSIKGPGFANMLGGMSAAYFEGVRAHLRGRELRHVGRIRTAAQASRTAHDGRRGLGRALQSPESRRPAGGSCQAASGDEAALHRVVEDRAQSRTARQ